MAAPACNGKLYPLFTLFVDDPPEPASGEGEAMSYLATAIFVALFLVGPTYFGFSDPHGKLSITLITCFVLGAVAGHKAGN